jgi:hypothetical protein
VAAPHQTNWSTEQSKLLECKDVNGDLTFKVITALESNLELIQQYDLEIVLNFKFWGIFCVDL